MFFLAFHHERVKTITKRQTLLVLMALAVADGKPEKTCAVSSKS